MENKRPVCILCILVLKPAATVGLCLSNYIGYLEKGGGLGFIFSPNKFSKKIIIANLQMDKMHLISLIYYSLQLL